jgi:hypothetical protein
MATFQPSEQQREHVSSLAAGGHMAVEQIAKTVLNPRTRRPISPKTLTRLFRKELSQNAEFQALVITRWREAVDKGEPWAIKLGVELTIPKEKEKEKAPDAAIKHPGITVRFVASSHSDNPRPAPMGVTPKPPWPQNPLPNHHSGPTIDGSSENFVRPLAQEVPPEPPSDNPANAEELLFRPLQGSYRTELDVPGEHTIPWHKRKLKGKLARGPLVWGRNGAK